jgi:hypothetical protein
MVEKTQGQEDLQDTEKKEKIKEPLPVCTTAPSAEHARSESDDEPCEDSRSGS